MKQTFFFKSKYMNARIRGGIHTLLAYKAVAEAV